MAIFEVYELEMFEPSQSKPASLARFARDKVSVIALILPGIWLLYHRLWIEFGLYLVFSALLFAISITPYSPAVMALTFLPGVYLFLEGQNLIAAKNRRSGYVLSGIVDAENLEAAEIKWFSTRKSNSGLLENPSTEKSDAKQVLRPSSPLLDEPEFGLFAQS